MVTEKKERGRPLMYSDSMKVTLHAKGRARLQDGSERRAVVNLLVSNGGVMTLGDINSHFGFDIKSTVIALSRAGWVDLS